MAAYPSPVLITGAGSELAQGLRARLEACGVPCFMACRSEKSLLACRGKGQAAALLTRPEDLPALCRKALGSEPEGLADFQHSPFESLLAQASPSDIEAWPAAGDAAFSFPQPQPTAPRRDRAFTPQPSWQARRSTGAWGSSSGAGASQPARSGSPG